MLPTECDTDEWRLSDDSVGQVGDVRVPGGFRDEKFNRLGQVIEEP